MGIHSHEGIPNTLREFYTEIVMGRLPGHSIMHKFGRNDSVLNGVWDLVSPTGPSGAFPSSGSPVRIQAGGHAEDTANGAGAREITVIGIDTNLIEVTETIATAGANASAYTTASFWRVYRSYVSAVGTYNGNNTTDIVLENGQIFALILAGEGQTQHGGFSIPTGKTGHLLNVEIMSDSAKPTDLRLFTRENFTNVTAPMSPKRLRMYFDGVVGQIEIQHQSPMLELPALSDIWFEARAGAGGSQVSVDFDILLVDDDPGHLKRM